MRNSRNREDAEVAVIIPNWNGMEWLDGCLGSLYRQDFLSFRTLVVDNGSRDGSVAYMKKHYPAVEIIELPENAGFAKAVNIGLNNSAERYVAVLNTDTIVDKQWLSSLVRKLKDSPPDVAAVNPKMLSMDDPGLIDDAGDELSWYGSATKRGHKETESAHDEEVEVFSPSGGASLYRRKFLAELGGFDASFFAYLEDVDLGLRGRLQGYRYLYLPAARVLHKGHGAGIPSARYVALATRNRLSLFIKNIPLAHLLHHGPKLLYGQFYFFIAQGHPLASLRGYGSFLLGLPELLQKRKQQMRWLRLENCEIHALLRSAYPEPSLRSCIKMHWARLVERLSWSVERVRH